MVTENITTIPSQFPGVYSQTLGAAGWSGYGRHHRGISDKDASFLSAQTINQNVQDGRLDSVKTDLESRDSIKTAVDHVGDLVLDKTCEVKDKVLESKYDVTNAVKDGDATLAKAICEAQYQNIVEATKNAAAINLTVEKTAAANMLFASQGFAASLLDSAKNAAASQLEANKNFAAIQLEATKNASAAALALEKCCCETKLLFKDVEIREVSRLLDACNQQATNSGIQTILSLLSGGILAAARPLTGNPH